MKATLPLAAACLAAASAVAQTPASVPALDFRGVDGSLAQEPVRVMVLGSDHLSRREGEIDQMRDAELVSTDAVLAE